jgi:hypothetical protein
MEIKKIKKFPFANITAFLYAIFAFLVTFGIFIYLLLKVILEKEMAGHLVEYIFINLGLDFLISLGVAVAAGVAGWIFGVIAAGMYNFFAREIGGVKVEFAEETDGAFINQKSTFAKTTVDKEKQELFKY